MYTHICFLFLNLEEKQKVTVFLNLFIKLEVEVLPLWTDASEVLKLV